MRQVFLLACLGAIGFILYKKQHPPIREYCEFALEHLLKSPSTLDIISTEVDTVYKKKVAITFDAANSYGAPVRSTIECELGLGGLKTLKTVVMNGEELSEFTLSEINDALFSKEMNY